VERVAVLASGGLDSAVLLADLAQEATVFPLYIEAGLAWEAAEIEALRGFLGALTAASVQPLTTLELAVGRLYGRHWSTTGEGIPDAASPDLDVQLPGRNVLLVALGAVWCSLHDVGTLAIGSLGGNPFPDATPAFFESYGGALSEGLAFPFRVVAPYRGRTKAQLIAASAELPLHLTLTCMSPARDAGGLVHCGVCNKCAERRAAFVAARVADRTRYAARP
jgi:7-cyano-7-deazaguanine synthase